MKKLHINPETGMSGVCNPEKTGICKYAVNGINPPHYDSPEEAQKAYELSQKSITLPKVNIGGLESAKRSTMYAEWSLIHDHLHCSSGVGNEGELHYYSSPAGKLELARRTSPESSYASDPHHKIWDALKENPNPELSITEEERERFNKHLEQGKKILEERNHTDKIEFLKTHKDSDIGAYLVEKSSEWFSKLTPKEQDAISFSTSSGFLLLQGSIDPDEVSNQTKHSVQTMYPKEVQDFEQSISNMRPSQKKTAMEVDFYYGKARKFTQIVKRAIKHAPVLDEPVKAYRGIKKEEFIKTFGNPGETPGQIKDRLISGEQNNKAVRKKTNEGLASKLTHSPLSSSLNPKRALTFTDSISSDKEDRFEVVYEIETKTLASPVIASAWGHGESEVYTNPSSKYEIVESRIHDLEGDNILIVKLREVLNNK